MLRRIEIDRLPNGKQVTIPAEINARNFEQQVKRFIEIADYNTFDGQMHLSFFRACHGGEWTIKIIEAVIHELQVPSVYLEITQERSVLLPFFEDQLERHRKMGNAEFRFSGNSPSLPM